MHRPPTPTSTASTALTFPNYIFAAYYSTHIHASNTYVLRRSSAPHTHHHFVFILVRLLSFALALHIFPDPRFGTELEGSVLFYHLVGILAYYVFGYGVGKVLEKRNLEGVEGERRSGVHTV
jgi:hypothetical protein